VRNKEEIWRTNMEIWEIWRKYGGYMGEIWEKYGNMRECASNNERWAPSH
jgi:hypothetical protein